MKSFPIFLKLLGRPVLVAGGGDAALAKVRLLKSAGASIRVVAPEVAEDIRAQLVGEQHKLRLGRFTPADLQDVSLVFAANGDEREDRRVAEAARSGGTLVNAVDRPELSDFTMPAIVDRDLVVVAISTEGASPVLSQRVRAAIEALLPPRLGRLADFARRFRSAVAAHIRDNAARRTFWEQAFDGPAGQAVLNGDEATGARELMRDLNGARGSPRSGQVFFLPVVAADPDALTLRAVRHLREADVIVSDRSIDAAILGHSRREARHIVAELDAAPMLFRLARGGARIARLVADDEFGLHRIEREAGALRQSGIAHQVLATWPATGVGMPSAPRGASVPMRAVE